MNLRPLALVLLCASLAEEETVCVHRGGGVTQKVSLDAVRRAQGAVKEKLRFVGQQAGRMAIDGPFESGLPSCPRRATRTVGSSLPRELVGKTIAFARADRMPKADLRVATSAKRIAGMEADALADRRLAERLGVRCVPTLVRVSSEVDLELVEGD